MGSHRPTGLLMRIRLHKILNEGRSVRFEKPDDDTIDVNIIVTREPRSAKQKTD